jgi:FtsZ-binding cell division protein ZapB
VEEDVNEQLKRKQKLVKRKQKPAKRKPKPVKRKQKPMKKKQNQHTWSLGSRAVLGAIDS